MPQNRSSSSAARFGHVKDPGGIDAYTYGAGIGLPIGDVAGLRYDFASYPESTGLPSLHRHAIQAWFDPIAMSRH
jgi:hypothetical protein